MYKFISSFLLNNTKIIVSVSDIPDIEVIFSDLSHFPVCGSVWSGIWGQKEAEICLSENLANSGYIDFLEAK